jgi:hypothetical protein
VSNGIHFLLLLAVELVSVLPGSRKMNFISRRNIITAFALATSAVVTGAVGKASSTDARILELGQEFDTRAAQIDHAIDDGSDIAWEVLQRFDRVESEIVVTPAETIAGLGVKARTARWALLDDLDTADQSTTDKRMMASIVRDLMRLSQWT